MSTVWVLSLRTSLPNVCEDVKNMSNECSVFETFEGAKTELRKLLKKYAYSENSMFDGKGNIKAFQEYIEAAKDGEYGDEYSLKSLLSKISQGLKGIFNGDDKPDVSFSEEADDSCYLSMPFEDVTLNLQGDYDGPINGYAPIIATNMFDMSEEKAYYLYIDDMFGQDVSSELHIDLIKVKVR